MFALGFDFLTGVAVMTDTSSRDHAEWPPHPARIFMALASAHYESKPVEEDGAPSTALWMQERDALLWLEAQGAPDMCWPEASPRSVVKVYVPVNDTSTPTKPEGVKKSEMRSALGVMPENRSRQERTFPSVHVGDAQTDSFLYLAWPDANPTATTLKAMESITSKIVRIGHSSSLVRAWVAKPETLPQPAHFAKPENKGSARLRVPAPGFLDELEERFNSDEIDAYFKLMERIGTTTGRENKTAKAEMSARFDGKVPVRRRPVAGLTSGYAKSRTSINQVVTTPFDPEILVLSKQEGPALGLEATSMLTTALRGWLLQDCEGKPEWFTGHDTEGRPSTGGHMALVPLAYVGTEYADGHLLGLGLVFPSIVPPKERGDCLRSRLFSESGEEAEIFLTLGKLGEWTLAHEDRPNPPLALRSATWAGPSTVWASVTPLVLDRHPKHDPRTERVQWREEVSTCIKAACERQQLPVPTVIDLDKTSWHRGAPRSRPGPGGMPLLPTKAGAARQQVHALIQFPCEVRGPLLLGAGRYRGYGFFKPLGSHQA